MKNHQIENQKQENGVKKRISLTMRAHIQQIALQFASFHTLRCIIIPCDMTQNRPQNASKYSVFLCWNYRRLHSKCLISLIIRNILKGLKTRLFASCCFLFSSKATLKRVFVIKTEAFNLQKTIVFTSFDSYAFACRFHGKNKGSSIVCSL